jgi:hypothetical protein
MIADPLTKAKSKFLGDLIIDAADLNENPELIFCYGDNLKRVGTGGAAALRHHSRAVGFITKKEPNNQDSSFYRPEEYEEVFGKELEKLCQIIKDKPSSIFLISKLGGGLANKYQIWEKIIKGGLEKSLTKFENVVFLWKNENKEMVLDYEN